MTEPVERGHADQEEVGASGRYPRRSLPAVAATLSALLLTPVAISIAANGAVLTGRWWDVTDRWLAPVQSVLGAVLLLAVAVLAVAVPVAAMAAGLVWGILPSVVQVVIPENTYRLISAVPGVPTDLDHALYSWLSGGVVLLIGVLLFGTGLTAALLRRKLAE